MRSIVLILSLLAAGTWLMPVSSGLDDHVEQGDLGLVWFSPSAPPEADGLKDEGLMPAAAGEDELWILDITGQERREALEALPGAYIRLEILPAADGNLSLHGLYPSGSEDVLLKASVEKDHRYTAWHRTEAEGEYSLWYSVDGSESSTVGINVSRYLEDGILPQQSRATGSFSGGGGVTAAPSKSIMFAPGAPLASSAVGLSAGGAKDVSNFRENIEQGYLPLPTDLAYEGLFYDYHFETGEQQECRKLFCPSYSYALSRDPFSQDPVAYLSVGLNSGLAHFQRKKLNLVVVLDYSGSMGSSFSQYYYDRFGNRVNLLDYEVSEKTKMQIADQSVVALLDHLKEDDRFSLVIFSDEAFVVDPLTPMGDKNQNKLKDRIIKIEDYGGTNLEAGMELGARLLDRYASSDPAEFENRMIVLTDAMPNLGETGMEELYRMLEYNAARGVYTTFIGIGVDFNTELVENIARIRGANYYSVNSAREFQERMDDEFEYMVTPLVFDLRLSLEAPGYQIEKVYGSPDADLATGSLMEVNTLFPSPVEEGQVRGGVILVKLRKVSEQSRMRLGVSYEDREGAMDGQVTEVELPDVHPDYYQNSGIRKAILLTRYADLLKDWMIDERTAEYRGRPVVAMVTYKSGIILPVELGQWERQSMALRVSEPYRKLFGSFESYFQKEAESIGDDSLQRELLVLQELSQ